MSELRIILKSKPEEKKKIFIDIGEKLSQSRKSSRTVICGTRYGNVIASRGSVIPLFIDQIQNNLPVTITDPNMTRFMMSLQDAVNLVLFAFENGNPGEYTYIKLHQQLLIL